jgi:hypothetical protein
MEAKGVVGVEPAAEAAASITTDKVKSLTPAPYLVPPLVSCGLLPTLDWTCHHPLCLSRSLTLVLCWGIAQAQKGPSPPSALTDVTVSVRALRLVPDFSLSSIIIS